MLRGKCSPNFNFIRKQHIDVSALEMYDYNIKLVCHSHFLEVAKSEIFPTC